MTAIIRKYHVPALFFAVLAACDALPEPGVADGGADATVVSPVQCMIGGCSGQLCVSADIEPPITTCEFRPEYACYESADCTAQADGHCGWTLTPELMECLAAAAEAPPEPSVEPPGPVDPGAECVTDGCSGQLCRAADADPIATTCEWRDEYACYQDATCERQASGGCGWTPSDALSECLAADGAAAQ
jgi:eight-cysteine-cluster-containing protein